MDVFVPTIDKGTTDDFNDLHGMVMTEDVSLLRQPMRPALTGFLEAKKAFENGTEEVRRLLLHECSLIYECNLCRNMFRSLVNFISHKRIYCKLSSEGNYRSYSDNNSSVIIQATEKRQEPWFNKSRSTGSSPIPTKTTSRDLSKVIERLKGVDVSGGPLKAAENFKQPTEQMSFELPQQQLSLKQYLPAAIEEPNPVLQLESVPTSTQAVYQTLNPLSTTDSIRTEVDEVHNLLTNQNTMIGPDGKAVVQHTFLNTPTKTTTATESFPSETSTVSSYNPLSQINPVGNVTCEICQMPFQTEKTLNIHVQKKHSSSTYVFQCPTCSLTFLQPAAVIRHLANEHKKPLKRIRKMRDSILKKRVQIGDVQVKGPSRELKRLQLDSTTKDRGEDAMQQQNGKPASTCSFCQKKFERRAAFATHLASCSAKKTLTSKENGDGISKIPRSSIKDEIQTKSKNQNTTTLAKNKSENQIELKNENTMKKVEPTSNIEQAITNLYKSNHLDSVNIKQEPQEDEFNSTSTHATTGSDINELFENLEKQTFGKGLQTVSLDLMVSTERDETASLETGEAEDVLQSESKDLAKLKSELTEDDHNIKKEPLQSIAETVVEKKKMKIKKTKGFRTIPVAKQLTCRCKICNKQFNALSNLRRHISMFHYRARRFGCNLCDYRAFRRYDIVNHLTFVHKMQGERESMAVEFVTMHDIEFSKDDVEHDILVVNDATEVIKESAEVHENNLKTYENKAKQKKLTKEEKTENLPAKKTGSPVTKTAEATIISESTPPKVVRKRLRKALAQVDSGQRRPIRNRIKTVNNDFVYDLSNLKEDSNKDPATRLALKRRNTMGTMDNKPCLSTELTPPIKMTPYRLRSEPLLPANKDSLKGFATRTYRNVVQEGLASPSTLPEMPTQRPQMRQRLSLPCRQDSHAMPVIEATELEVARLETTFFDDSFLEKFAKKANPSFKMKPLLASQSPLNSILQKFENNSNKLQTAEDSHAKSQENGTTTPLEHDVDIATDLATVSVICSTDSADDILDDDILEQLESLTPNGKHIMEPLSPPSTPRKRVTLMERLAENRAKRRDSLLRSALEN